MSVLNDIAEAVKDALNDATLSQQFTAERVYIPVFKTEEMGDELKLFVLGLAQKAAIAEGYRGAHDWNYEVRIAVYKRVDREDTQALDAMSSFVEEVIDLMRTTKKRVTDQASWVGVANEPVWDPAQLEQHGVYVSVIRLT